MPRQIPGLSWEGEGEELRDVRSQGIFLQRQTRSDKLPCDRSMNDDLTEKDLLGGCHRVLNKIDPGIENAGKFGPIVDCVPKFPMFLFNAEEIGKLTCACLSLKRHASKEEAKNDTYRLNQIEPVGLDESEEGCHPVIVSRRRPPWH